MANTIQSANMNLPIPIVGVQTGPDYGLNIDACLQIIDIHDHSPGYGVQITQSGINIDDDFSLNNNDLIEVRTVRFYPQSSLPATTPDLGCLTVIGDDLYYNDVAGNQIRITQSGSVAGASGTITGLPSGTASAAYSAPNGSFVFQSATSTPADIDGGSSIIREKVANGKSVTLSAPAGLAADYVVTMPAALPGSTKFLTIDSGGAVADSVYVDNSSIEISANNMQVKAGGITTAMLGSSLLVPLTKGGTGQTSADAAAQALLGNFSKSASGYLSLGNNFKLNWGITLASSAAAGTTTSVTFSSSFSTYCVAAFASPYYNVIGVSNYYVTALTTSGATFQRANYSNLDTGTYFFWIAIGY